jgi:hypothetical protein
MRLARSSSSPLLFMSADGTAAGLPSVRDMRDTLLIEGAHNILNDSTHTLYGFAHSRLLALRDELGWNQSSLANPQDIPPSYFAKHWLARPGHALAQHNF